MPSNTEHAKGLLCPARRPPQEVVATKGAFRALQPRLWRVEKGGVLVYLTPKLSDKGLLSEIVDLRHRLHGSLYGDHATLAPL
jgi:hypothetical protein